MRRRTALGGALSALLITVEAATVDVKVTPYYREIPLLEEVTIFIPPSVRVQAGDTVNFLNSTGFRLGPRSQWNQTITQSAFDPPCLPLPRGFTTGAVQDYDGSPLWFYTEEHCGNGATFTINPNEEPDARSYEAYDHLARLRNSTLSDRGSDGAAIEAPWPNESDQSFPTLAWPNTSVRFFIKDNVTVTQSSFSDPCNPLVKEDGSPGWSSRKSGIAQKGLHAQLSLQINDASNNTSGYVVEAERVASVLDRHHMGTLAASKELAKQAPSESSIFDKEPKSQADNSHGSVVYPLSKMLWFGIPLMFLVS
ncbi:hypothetical protein BKA70DRAFT_1440643 [Coprinopsis sp. MPI-PUGE-AT-0042]|nr:hypothetical protein BKA70DRAFT_1440643 [Coprinopsis sp. MPI-PUGE-AT-0042]